MFIYFLSELFKTADLLETAAIARQQIPMIVVNKLLVGRYK